MDKCSFRDSNKMQVHLGFDMGIRNLAFCLITHTGDTWAVNAWDNIDLLEGGTTSQDAKRCVACSGPAKWIGEGAKWCMSCATGVRRKKSAKRIPVLPTLSCGQSVKELRDLVGSGLADVKKTKKPELLTWLSNTYLMPWKPAKTMDASLGVILTAMDKWLDSVLPTFAAATLIRLENQPVMKGPTMKSVQIILYTLLMRRLRVEHAWSGRIEFVHAGTKSKGAAAAVPTPTAGTAAESAAYRNRKKTAESDVTDILTTAACAEWLAYFNGKSKKSDLADAFLMAYRK